MLESYDKEGICLSGLGLPFLCVKLWTGYHNMARNGAEFSQKCHDIGSIGQPSISRGLDMGAWEHSVAGIN